MRKNASGVVENAEFNINQEVYRENHASIFPETKKFCDVCDKRFSMCECKKEKSDEKTET